MLPLIIFILVPMAEIAMFMVVGDIIGFWYTLALVVITAFIGTYLLKQQGLAVLSQAQQSSAKGQLPVHSVIDGLFLLVAGAFLLTPGILTDLVGFSFMIPGVRRFLGTYLYKKFAKNISVSTFGFEAHSFDDLHSPSHNTQSPDFKSDFGHSSPKDMPFSDGPIIEGEVIEPEQKNSSDRHNPDKTSPWKKTE